MKTVAMRHATALAALVAAIGCAQPPPDFRDMPKATAPGQAQQRSKDIAVDFYLDASKPMAGFLAGAKDPKRDYLGKLLQESGSIIMKGWEPTTARYWSFGERTERVETIDAFLRPPKGSAGNSRFTHSRSRIHDAVRHVGSPEGASTDHLRVIVTDLFLTDANASDLAKELAGPYLTNGERAVVILGLRNAFKGGISDLPGSIPAGGASTLPLYVIVAGRTADVRQMVRNLDEYLDISESPGETFQMFFANRLADDVTRPLAVRPLNASGAPGFFHSKTLALPEVRERGISQIKVTAERVPLELLPVRHEEAAQWPKRAAGSARRSFPGAEVTALGGLLARKAPQAQTRVRVWTSGTQGVAASPEATRAFTLDLATSQLLIDKTKLASGATYLLEFDVLAEQERFWATDAPENAQGFRIQDWSLEPTDAVRIVEQKGFDVLKDKSQPGRTPNLRQFLQTLSDQMFRSEIRLARYALIVTVA